MNVSFISGNIGQEPKNAENYIALRVAVNTSKTYTIWFTIFLSKHFEYLLKYLHKGTKVVAWGSVTIEPWTRSDGKVEISYTMNAYNIELCQQVAPREQETQTETNTQNEPF